MTRTRAPRGDTKLGCILWTLLLLALILVVWKTAPVWIKSGQLEDYMGEQAKFSQRASAEALKKRIVRRAGELDLPVNPKRVKVEKSYGRIRIVADYDVPIDFAVYDYTWNFHLEVDEPVFVW